jgi:hypothetical protein
MAATSVEVPKDQQDYLEQVAAEHRASKAWAVRWCIDRAMEITDARANGRERDDEPKAAA